MRGRTFWWMVHNMVAHPLLVFGWRVAWVHERTAKKAGM